MIRGRTTWRTILRSRNEAPFVLVFNLQVPSKRNYSLVFYYAADRPPNPNSLFPKFVDGSLKIIPSIAQGYWMVKHAVGTKTCLLGKAVSCKYLRQDNFLEIDVDIGSSSEASIIGLVLRYVTSIVLPEYILGNVQLNRLKRDSAVHLEV
ncbi:protein ENHANCED DISEASE RESISTANCE 2-like [Pyrus ussuriensis x Pyrus communis]|uniref:Protein ENHANCED DISEASE RESISTANCE 2-like n=1 Tax=Pyrus ussuriensis x Pyrus communis TaxID=2448454 RepID=A0A5N5FC34_9ROSA|nr:protein ENHANCED DISEASE RESISTANCE 2-like [Pyrus ussuriensis x Pyrus communis]